MRLAQSGIDLVQTGSRNGQAVIFNGNDNALPAAAGSDLYGGKALTIIFLTS